MKPHYEITKTLLSQLYTLVVVVVVVVVPHWGSGWN